MASELNLFAGRVDCDTLRSGGIAIRKSQLSVFGFPSHISCRGPFRIRARLPWPFRRIGSTGPSLYVFCLCPSPLSPRAAILRIRLRQTKAVLRNMVSVVSGSFLGPVVFPFVFLTSGSSSRSGSRGKHVIAIPPFKFLGMAGVTARARAMQALFCAACRPVKLRTKLLSLLRSRAFIACPLLSTCMDPTPRPPSREAWCSVCDALRPRLRPWPRARP